MTKSSFRKRKREVERFQMELLPAEVFPEEAVLLEADKRRISNILLEFALPLTSGAEEGNFFQFKTMIYFAAVGWNYSYFKEGTERKSALDRFLLNSDFFTEENRGKMYNIVDSLAMRKKKSFWQYDFMIIDFEVLKGEKGMSLIARGIPYALINAFSAFGSGVSPAGHKEGEEKIQ